MLINPPTCHSCFADRDDASTARTANAVASVGVVHVGYRDVAALILPRRWSAKRRRRGVCLAGRRRGRLSAGDHFGLLADAAVENAADTAAGALRASRHAPHLSVRSPLLIGHEDVAALEPRVARGGHSAVGHRIGNDVAAARAVPHVNLRNAGGATEVYLPPCWPVGRPIHVEVGLASQWVLPAGVRVRARAVSPFTAVLAVDGSVGLAAPAESRRGRRAAHPAPRGQSVLVWEVSEMRETGPGTHRTPLSPAQLGWHAPHYLDGLRVKHTVGSQGG